MNESDQPEIVEATLVEASAGSPLDDVALAFAALAKSSTENRFPAEEYLAGKDRLWNYSEMPNCCPLCGHRFHAKSHPRRLRRRSWLLIVATLILSPILGLFVPIPGSPIALAGLLILGIMMLPKAVNCRCGNCQWAQRFIVRSGSR